MDATGRQESIKLVANTLNAFAILLVGGALFSDWLEPARTLDLEARFWMIFLGVVLHSFAHFVLVFLDV